MLVRGTERPEVVGLYDWTDSRRQRCRKRRARARAVCGNNIPNRQARGMGHSYIYQVAHNAGVKH